MPLPSITKPPKQLESAILARITAYMRDHGWRAIRFHRSPLMFQSGEVGQPDTLFLRYLGEVPGQALHVWCEAKGQTSHRECTCLRRLQQGKKDKCTTCNQADWRKREELRGGLVWTGNSFEDWLAFYDAKFGWLHEGEGLFRK